MRTKLFIVLFSGIILIMLIAAPIKHILTDSGVLKSDNVGNIIEVDKVYSEDAFGADFFNGVEQVKRQINDTYINYMPFYVAITNTSRELQHDINEPISSLLLKKGNEITKLRRDEERVRDYLDAIDRGELPAQTTAPADTSQPDPSQPSTGTVTPDKDIPLESVLLSEPYFEYVSNDGQHRYYTVEVEVESSDKPLKFLARVPGADAKKMVDKMEAQLSKINALAKAVPEVNFYLWAATSFEDTAMCDEWLPSESKYGIYTDFFAGLDPSIQAGCTQYRSFEEYVHKHFLTDHHWSLNGYLDAYTQLEGMLAENYSDITPLVPTVHTINGLQFYGSNCRLAGSYELSDILQVAEFPLADHQLVIEDGVPYGSLNDFATNLKRYQAGDYETVQGYDHYIEFFRIPRKITYPANNTGRNLLVIGDSYSPPILEALASHFDVTYVHYVGSNSKLPKIDYTDYVKANSITDVMIIEMGARVAYDYYDDSLLNVQD